MAPSSNPTSGRDRIRLALSAAFIVTAMGLVSSTIVPLLALSAQLRELIRCQTTGETAITRSASRARAAAAGAGDRTSAYASMPMAFAEIAAADSLAQRLVTFNAGQVQASARDLRASLWRVTVLAGVPQTVRGRSGGQRDRRRARE
jgi:hypothetical protein